MGRVGLLLWSETPGLTGSTWGLPTYQPEDKGEKQGLKGQVRGVGCITSSNQKQGRDLLLMAGSWKPCWSATRCCSRATEPAAGVSLCPAPALKSVNQEFLESVPPQPREGLTRLR